MLSGRVSLVRSQIRPFLVNLRLTSNTSSQTRNVIQSEEEQKANVSADPTGHFDEIKTVFKKIAKQPARDPLVKNFFTGKADTELLTYPEVINRDDMNTLQQDIDETLKYFNNCSIPVGKQLFDDLKKLKSFGVNCKYEEGGRGYNYTESCLNAEAETEHLSGALVLNSHRLFAQILNDFGTEEQKKLYISRVAGGNLLGTVAFFETDACKHGLLNTTAKLSPNEKSFLIKGVKSFVINGNDSNMFIVLAETVNFDKLGDVTKAITAFLVDSTMPGVRILAQDKTIGCKGVPHYTVEFDNVEVPLENIIGGQNNGAAVVQKMLINARIQSAVLSVILAKKIIQKLTAFCIDTQQFGLKFMEMEFLRKKLSKVVCSTYALESMLYYTTALIDGYESQDVEVETAILKSFAQQSLLSTALTAFDFMGPKTIAEGDSTETFLQDSLQLYANNETIDSLKLFIGYSGLQHAGLNIHETVKMIRNPLFHPSFFFKKMFEDVSVENPKTAMHLNHYLHPSFDMSAHWLEHSIGRLRIGTQIMLSRHGKEVVSKQMEVMRLSECASLAYAMYASLSRASRSYCIGLRHCDYEMITASTFAFEAMQTIKRNITEVHEGLYFTSDMHYNKIAEEIFKSQGYFPEHPLKRNF